MSTDIDWVAVDWGTSNLRAWGIAPGGRVAFSRMSDQGMARLARDAYGGALSGLLAGHVEADGAPLEVLVCGMAGARQGWLEAPYLDAPADLGDLVAHAVRPEVPGGRLSVRILPGICQRQEGTEDVMRGEETQLLGLGALVPGFSGVVCMPGTHCKWVQLDGRRVVRFATAMTGELFEVLRTHSVLRHSLGGELDGPDRAAGLEAGLAAGLAAPQKLSVTLFKVRAGSLLAGRQPDWCAGFLSGLLIGAEIGAQRDWIGGTEIPIVGGIALAQLYARGLTMIGARARILDATEATLAGLRAARSSQ